MRTSSTHITRPDEPHGADARRREEVILNRYRVLETNDEGGFGTVNVCWDTRLQRRVAIKRMPLRVAGDSSVSASTLDEALREARTSSLLPHENIVTVHDFEADERYSYLVMEYVDGLNLADLLARVEGGVLSFDECAHMLKSVASALTYAHENGVLHLDIKPANIMIDRNGTVKLGDFGMATLASAAGYGGARGGTIGYMPPEQIEGGSVDERSDIFSLAVVVYEALTGSCPFRGESARESLQKIKRGPEPPLSQVEPGLAGIVEETLLCALDPDPANRMSSVEDFAKPIVAFLGDPEEGRASLSDLISQTDSDGPADTPPADLPLEPLLVRHPWLPSAVVRAATAACTAYAAFETVPVYLPGSAEARLVGALAAGAAGAAWTPLGSAIALASLAATFFCQNSSAAFPLGLLVTIVGGVWWLAIGRRDGLTSLSLLLPPCLRCAAAGSYVAGYALSPGSAFVTSAFSWSLCSFASLTRENAFAALPVARALRAAVTSPLAYVMPMAAGIAALACSLAQSSSHAPARVAGEIACFAIPLTCALALPEMENGSIPLRTDIASVAIALTLCVIMCMTTVLVGPPGRVQESEDFR